MGGELVKYSQPVSRKGGIRKNKLFRGRGEGDSERGGGNRKFVMVVSGGARINETMD